MLIHGRSAGSLHEVERNTDATTVAAVYGHIIKIRARTLCASLFDARPDVRAEVLEPGVCVARGVSCLQPLEKLPHLGNHQAQHPLQGVPQLLSTV